jgi:hypothetical protein
MTYRQGSIRYNRLCKFECQLCRAAHCDERRFEIGARRIRNDWRHVRNANGVAHLPLGAGVEVEMILQLKHKQN